MRKTDWAKASPNVFRQYWSGFGWNMEKRGVRECVALSVIEHQNDETRRRRVAIVLVDDAEGSRAWALDTEKREGARRARITTAQLFTIAYTFDIAFDIAAGKWFGKLLPKAILSFKHHDVLRELAPSYTDIRNYLAWDIECHYRDACVVAFAVVAGRSNWRSRFEATRHDLGEWL